MKTLACSARRRRQRRAYLLTIGVAVLALGAAAAVAAFVAEPSEPAEAGAEGQRGFLLACIQSEADGPVHFQYRWGREGRWLSADATTDQSLPLALAVGPGAANAALAELIVRYDDDPGEDSNLALQRVRVVSAQSASCHDGGASHRFRVRDDELFLDAENDGDSAGDGALVNNRLVSSRDRV